MKHNHENKMLCCTAIFSTFISICVLALGISYGNKLKNEKEDSTQTIRIESPDSKLMMVAMRCHKMEQDNDMLRLRIEELEDTIAEFTNKNSEVCGQYYLYQVEPQEAKVDISLAVDDLVSTNSL